MSWQNALVQYAKTPPAKVAKDVYLAHDAHTLTIRDKYPKARYHFLCLPRLPMRLPIAATAGSGSGLRSGAGGDDEAEEEEHAVPTEDAGDTVSERQLHSLADLLACRYGLRVLRLLKAASEEIVELVQEEMLKEEGFVWPISVGFHPVESMAHVHLHIISQDFVSDALKNKKHWNSFNPEHGFFMHLDKLLAWLEEGTLRQHNKSKAAYEALLKADLKCHRCGETFATVPKLKNHLQRDFSKLRKEGLEARQNDMGSMQPTASTASLRKRSPEPDPPTLHPASKKAKTENSSTGSA